MNEDVQVVVRRSARRRRSVTAFREGEAVVVAIPASMSQAQERQWVDRMVARVLSKESGHRVGDAELQALAVELSGRYLGTAAKPSSVRWVGNMRKRWGSCTSADRTIRISDRLRQAPPYVLECVVLHELAHLIEPNHGPRFWELANRHPKAERAEGFLEAWGMVGDDELN